MPQANYDQAQIVDALWSKGVLWWKLKPVQRLMYQREMASSSRLWVENCARRLGKSFRLAIRALECALTIPEAVIPFAAPTLKMIRYITIPIFRQICTDAPWDIQPEWRPSEGKFIIPFNKSEIILAGVNNGHADDLRGRKADLALVDEAGFVDDLDYLVQDVLMPQLLTTNGKIIMSSSPSYTPAHPFKKYCGRALSQNCYSEYDIYQAGYPPETVAEFCAEAGGAESTTWRREYLCQFVTDSDLHIIPEWRKDYEQAIPRNEYFSFYHLYVGMDMGVRDKTVVLFGYRDFLNARTIVEDEIVMHGPEMTTEKLADAIRKKEKELWGEKKTHRRIADNNNPLMLLDLASIHKISFMPTQKTGKTERTTILESMVNALRIEVGAGRFIVHPRCKELIGCLRFGIWNEHRTTFERVEEYGHFDALAAAIYLNENVDKVTNPIPRTLGLSIGDHFISPDLKKDPMAEKMKKMLNLNRRRD